MTRAKTYFTDNDPENIDVLETTDLIVAGIASIGNLSVDSVSLTTLGIGTTNPQYTLEVIGDINFTGSLLKDGEAFIAEYSNASGISTYSNVSGISTYSNVSGISTVAQGLTGTPNITVGIVTAGSYVSSGTTAVYSGINTSVIDSNTTSVHYITFDTNSSAVNISNFTSGRKVDIIARNSSGSNRTLIIRTSTTTTEHTIVSPILHASGTITNGAIPIGQSNGFIITIHNVNGTVVGAY